ncbi:hypothetical protein [Halodurantibacterium flavum]|uniref:Uncharacterized protein n=1 Tax=Halodurantibacterium flavum TaxID=1382802 RepID=A0ABW4S945_9RHOB
MKWEKADDGWRGAMLSSGFALSCLGNPGDGSCQFAEHRCSAISVHLAEIPPQGQPVAPHILPHHGAERRRRRNFA